MRFENKMEQSNGLDEAVAAQASQAGTPPQAPDRVEPAPAEPPAPADALDVPPAPVPGAPNGDASSATPPDAGLPEDLWARLRTAIRSRIQHEQFETWFRRTTLTGVDAATLTVAVQNRFTRDWLHGNYREVLEQAVVEVLGGPRKIVIAVDQESALHQGEASPPPAGAPDRVNGHAGASARTGSREAPARRTASAGRSRNAEPPARRLHWSSDVALNPGYRFDNFVVGPCNRFAHAAAVGVSKSPGQCYNPLFIHGNVGYGKTHLLQSLCYSILDREPETRILYLSCETFVNHFISAIENGDLQKFRNKYRNVGVMVVDDIHLLANKERTQEEFFHTFNTLYNSGKQIVLSSDSPPKEIPSLQERLVSRFNWGLVTEIEPACYETRVAILKRKSKERGRELPDDVCSLLAEHIDTNVRDLEGAVTRIIGYTSLNGRAISVDLARQLLRDVFAPRRGQPTMDDIIRIVTAHFNIKLSDLQSRKRTNAIAYPRQVAMYLARKITRHSLEEIGGFFGGRDHSTVLYGVEKITKQLREDPRNREMIASLLNQLQQADA